jgi:hypothetical protein
MELTCQRAHLKIPAGEFASPSGTKEVLASTATLARPRRLRRNPGQEEVRRRRWQHKVELLQQVKSLRAQGV